MRFQFLRFAAAVTGGLFLMNCAAKEDGTDEGSMPAETGTGTGTGTAPLPTPSNTGTGTAPTASIPPTATAPASTTATSLTTAPVASTSAPVASTSAPAASTTAPAASTTAPAASTTAPAESSAEPSGSGGETSLPEATGGAGGGSDTSTGGAGGAPPSSGGDFTLTSTNFNDGDELPDTYTCEGKAFGVGPIPELKWENAPEGTLSFGLAFVDTKLLGEQGDDSQFANHWVMWNIGADISEIPEGAVDAAKLTALGGAQQTGGGFLGPCPSISGPATDTYAFVLYALKVAELPMPTNNVFAVRQAMEANMLGKIELTSSSDAAPN